MTEVAKSTLFFESRLTEELEGAPPIDAIADLDLYQHDRGISALESFMSWRRGLFRMWVVLTALWSIMATLFMWESISTPYISWGGFTMGHGEPEYLEPYGEKISAARELKSRKLLVEYEISYDKTDLKQTAFFFPATAVHEENLKAIEAYIPKATALQNAKIKRARYEAITSALWAVLLPPGVILILGLAVRWALMGFRPRTSRLG